MTAPLASIIDGRLLAEKFRTQIAQQIREISENGGHVALDAVLVDEAPASPAEPARQEGGAGKSAGSGKDGWGATATAARVYAENQRKTCAEMGIDYRLHVLPHTASFEDIAGRLLLLSAEESVTAIMLHLPVPSGVDAYRLQSLIAAQKDVEGVNPVNIGNVVYGRSSLVPCTALAVMKLVESTGLALPGTRVVCIGTSDLVGKPIAVLMMRERATVITCNSATRNLSELTRTADVLVAAVGKPRLVTAEMVKPGAIVIDVGVNRVTDPTTGKKTIVGDVDFESVRKVAGAITPVPGGVGPVTVAMLLRNTVDAALRREHAPRHPQA